MILDSFLIFLNIAINFAFWNPADIWTTSHSAHSFSIYISTLWIPVSKQYKRFTCGSRLIIGYIPVDKMPASSSEFETQVDYKLLTIYLIYL